MKQILEAIERSAIRIKHAIDVKDIPNFEMPVSCGSVPQKVKPQ